MPALSKTGLLPILLNSERLEQASTQLPTFEVPKFCSPAPFVLRPFAGVYNPFPYGCSVLCNHPADCEAKDVVKKAKETWAQDGRALASCEGGIPLLSHRPSRCGSVPDDGLPPVPEELFRRYTETDSRPITPAPTIASVVTRSSQIRRCMTPDAVCTQQGKERTLLVLDLRRSHSQETLNWFGAMAPAATPHAPTRASSVRSASTTSAVSPTTNRKKKALKSKSSISPNQSVVIPETHDVDTEASIKLKQQVLSSVKTLGVSDTEGALSDRTGGSSAGEGDVVKRRGKKKKKSRKGGKYINKEGEKEFQGIPDPGETQVSTLGESRVGSTRPSLTPGAPAESADAPPTMINVAAQSFLPQALLKQLQRQLDQEAVESEFDVKRKIALEEALRTRPPAKLRYQSEELKGMKKELNISENSTQKWLTVPRVFSRKSSRFELPMDGRKILSMTCLEYASQCVFPSSERLVLYNQVFNLHREELDEDEQMDRTLLGKNLLVCLDEVMGRPLAQDEGQELIQRLGIQPTIMIDFRTFAGVAAICERILGASPPRTEDPPHTLELADFRSLARLTEPLPPDSHLMMLLKDIKNR